MHENKVYRHLQAIQGTHVPVCLGVIDVAGKPLCYDGIADSPHLLLLAHAGIQFKHSGVAREEIVSQASTSLQAIHDRGVYHGDVAMRNMFWGEESGTVLVIDFERAEILPVRPPLEITSPNAKHKLKRKRGDEDAKVRDRDRDRDRVERLLREERRNMVKDLQAYVK